VTATATPAGGTDWVRAATELRPRTEAFVDGAFVPAASGATFADQSPRDGRRLADVARRRRRGRRSGGQGGPARV
jgi:hypothetical protein